MYIEIAVILLFISLITFCSYAFGKQNSRFLYIVWICLILGSIACIGNYNSWVHETKVITVSEKMIIGNQMKVVDTEGVIYDVPNIKEYAKLKINQSLTVNTAYNQDNKNNGGYIYNNIDGVLPSTTSR